MKYLELKDCAGFISYAKPCDRGWLEILQGYAGKGQSPEEQAVGSWYDGMSRGKTFQDSLRAMKPAFPLCLQTLLVIGFENSWMDYVLKDIDDIYKSTSGTKDLYDDLSLLVDKYNSGPKSEFICDGCLLRELDRIIARVRLEKAGEVLFEQDGERFFIQRYLGPKAVTYAEPCHSKVYKTLIKYFEECSNNREAIVLSGDRYQIKKTPDEKYCLYNNDMSVLMSFI